MNIIDNDIIELLKIVKNHTTVERLFLQENSQHKLSEQSEFNVLLDHLINTKLVEMSTSGVIGLTEHGHDEFTKLVLENDVENEDTSNSSAPTRPYEVSKLKMEPKFLSVFQALRKIEKEEIFLNPEFQRAFVWDVDRQSRLIESILIRIPLPAFYLDATDQIKWTVVDGLQRLTTLYRYCRKEEFELSGLEFLPELEGKKFSDLPPQYKVLIEDDTQLQFYNLMPGTPVEAKFTIFSRVNTGGLQLTSQEIRHALNQGNITTLLGKMSKNELLSSVFGTISLERMADREIILRSLSFSYFGYENYSDVKELNNFLLDSMRKFNKLDTATLEKLSIDFFDSVRKVNAIFGRYSYRKFAGFNARRSPFNKALFEVWTTCVGPYSESQLVESKFEIANEFEKLCAYDDAFKKSISSSTGSNFAVITRFSRIEKLLANILK